MLSVEEGGSRRYRPLEMADPMEASAPVHENSSIIRGTCTRTDINFSTSTGIHKPVGVPRGESVASQ